MFNEFLKSNTDIEIKKFIDELEIETIQLEEKKIMNNDEVVKIFNFEISDNFKIEILTKLNKEIMYFLDNLNDFNNISIDVIKTYFYKNFQSGCGVDIDMKFKEIGKYSFAYLTHERVGDIVKYMNEYRISDSFSNLTMEAKKTIYNMFGYLENSEFKPKEQNLEDFYQSIVSFLVEIFNSHNDYYLVYLQLKYINYENNIKIIEGMLGNLDANTREEFIKTYNLKFL